MKPLISIVTITLNSESYLHQTIESVASQSYSELEYVIVDGKSTDSTLSIIESHSDVISTFISERDGGIADAMNKALDLVTGDFILFLHSDDYLNGSTAVESAVAEFDAIHDIFAFGIAYGSNDSYQVRTPSWGRGMNFKSKLLHQGVFCRSDVFSRIGSFDTQLKIAMDYDFFLRAYRGNIKVKVIPEAELSVMRDTGVGSRTDWRSVSERLSEEKRVHMKHCVGESMRLMYKVYWSFYPAYKRAVMGMAHS